MTSLTVMEFGGTSVGNAKGRERFHELAGAHGTGAIPLTNPNPNQLQSTNQLSSFGEEGFVKCPWQ